MKKFTDFYGAWQYLLEHNAFVDEELKETTAKNGDSIIWSAFPKLLNIDVVKTNPDTHYIDDDDSKNIFTEVWLKIGPYAEETDREWIRVGSPKWNLTHDTRLDCGGGTFEKAIVKLANLVEKFYPLKKYGKIEE